MALLLDLLFILKPTQKTTPQYALQQIIKKLKNFTLRQTMAISIAIKNNG